MAAAALPKVPKDTLHFQPFLAFLQKNSIRCVVFDMDKTLVTMHSGGCVPREELIQFAESITPTARLLIPFLIASDIRVAVATFADDLYASYGRNQVAGVELVRTVLSELPCFQQPQQLDAVPIVTINPALYDVERKFRSALGAAAGQQEQAKMKSALSSSSSPPSELETFFTSKLAAFGLDASHPSWSVCSAFPPADFKCLHLQWIAARLHLQLHELMLIDDRDENVTAAVEQGSWGCYLGRKKGIELADLKEANFAAPATQAAAAQK
jgi:hypothetical protein